MVCFDNLPQAINAEHFRAQVKHPLPKASICRFCCCNIIYFHLLRIIINKHASEYPMKNCSLNVLSLIMNSTFKMWGEIARFDTQRYINVILGNVVIITFVHDFQDVIYCSKYESPLLLTMTYNVLCWSRGKGEEDILFA